VITAFRTASALAAAAERGVGTTQKTASKAAVFCRLPTGTQLMSVKNVHPFVNSDRKPEPSYYPALAAFDIKVDRKSKFPVLLLAMATVYRTLAIGVDKGVYL
jgi:hypothetical protein